MRMRKEEKIKGEGVRERKGETNKQTGRQIE